ncbi:hypothetical protein CsSME_00053925 [Camellia sinensis var. sinensis]
MSALCYSYRRLHHGAQHIYSLLPESGGSFMELTNKCVRSEKFSGICKLLQEPPFAPPEEVPDQVKSYGHRSSVIQGLLAGYDTKPIEAGLGRDKA